VSQQCTVAKVAPAGSFREEVKSATLRWLSQGEHTGSCIVEKRSVSLSSSIGRRDENQDRTLFLRLLPQAQAWPVLEAIVLCDGMGGMVEGATAAELALSSFVGAFSTKKYGSLADHLCAAVEAANEDVYRRFRGQGGATLSSVAVSSDGEMAGVNVGDSRIYGLLEDDQLVQFSKDDTLGNVLSELATPGASARLGELLQFVGLGKGTVPHRIDLRNSLSPFKCLFLTSDGAHRLHQPVFDEVVKSSPGIVEIAKRLTALAEWTGGKDNATVAIWHAPHKQIQQPALEGRGSLEIWGIQGKYELTTRQDSASYSPGRDSGEVRGSRRKPPTRNRRVSTGERADRNSESDDTRREPVVRFDSSESDQPLSADSLERNKNQLEIEVLEN
jgi:serine/threonine protein phosphatase PrpC